MLESQSNCQQRPRQQKEVIEHEPVNRPVEMSLDLEVNEPETKLQRCKPYATDIYAYLRERELVFRVSPQYMQTQRDINATMRAILVDWLVEVRAGVILCSCPDFRYYKPRLSQSRYPPTAHCAPSTAVRAGLQVAEEYRLEAETLHLSVNYIDRFLGYVPVSRSKLQLVGVSCMLLAAKFEEIHPPGVDEFVYISDNTYQRHEILAMEGTILNRLQFELSVATPKTFLSRYLRAAQIGGACGSTAASLCHYLCELTLQEYAILKFRPSELAAAALRLALHTVHLPAWSAALEAMSGYDTDALSDCVADVLRVYRNAEANNLQAVREKYSHAKFLCVSLLTPPASPP
jgi:cyclin A